MVWLQGSKHSSEHGTYVWKHFIAQKEDIKKVLIVAHSAGGGVTSEILSKNEDDFMRRVYAIALTDSWCQGTHKTKSYFPKVRFIGLGVVVACHSRLAPHVK